MEELKNYLQKRMHELHNSREFNKKLCKRSDFSKLDINTFYTNAIRCSEIIYELQIIYKHFFNEKYDPQCRVIDH